MRQSVESVLRVNLLNLTVVTQLVEELDWGNLVRRLNMSYFIICLLYFVFTYYSALYN